MVSFSKSCVVFLVVTCIGCGLVLYYAYMSGTQALRQPTGAVVEKHAVKLNQNATLKKTSRNSLAAVYNISHLQSYCVNNSRLPECCSESHCAIVKHSTLYSECCQNSPRPNPKFTGRQYPVPILPILITATPRSGTVFVCHLLQQLGISTNNDGHSPTRPTRIMVSWLHVMKERRYFMDTSLYGSKFQYMWHQTRDPLQSLTSLAFTEPLNETTRVSKADITFIKRHIPLTPLSPLKDTIRTQAKTQLAEDEVWSRFLIHRGMEFYNGWHHFILQLNIPRFSLEDLTTKQNYTVLNDIFGVLGRPPPSRQEVQKTIVDMRRRRRRQRQLQSNTPKKKNQFNSRQHRSTLEWEELCVVNSSLAQDFLVVSHKLGYYLEKEQAC